MTRTVALAFAAALLLVATPPAGAAVPDGTAFAANAPAATDAQAVNGAPAAAPPGANSAAPASPPAAGTPAAGTPAAGTAPPAPSESEAARRYERGVALYTDGDYRGALVEFKQAYAVAPRPAVLYDIGQTELQLADHAAALRSLTRYLAEAGADAPHRAEVEASVATLRTRVGHLAIVVDGVRGAAACELAIDDQPVGATPIEAPVAVTAGARKVALNCPNQGVTAGRVDVAAGQTVRVELHVPPPPIAAVRAAMAAGAAREGAHEGPSSHSFTIAWTAAGLLLMGTAAVGTAALVEQGRLDALRATYPVTERQLDRQSQLVKGLSLTTDIIGAATVATTAIATWLTVKYHRERRLHSAVHARGMSIGGTF